MLAVPAGGSVLVTKGDQVCHVLGGSRGIDALGQVELERNIQSTTSRAVLLGGTSGEEVGVGGGESGNPGCASTHGVHPQPSPSAPAEGGQEEGLGAGHGVALSVGSGTVPYPPVTVDLLVILSHKGGIHDQTTVDPGKKVVGKVGVRPTLGGIKLQAAEVGLVGAAHVDLASRGDGDGGRDHGGDSELVSSGQMRLATAATDTVRSIATPSRLGVVAVHHTVHGTHFIVGHQDGGVREEFDVNGAGHPRLNVLVGRASGGAGGTGDQASVARNTTSQEVVVLGDGGGGVEDDLHDTSADGKITIPGPVLGDEGGSRVREGEIGLVIVVGILLVETNPQRSNVGTKRLECSLVGNTIARQVDLAGIVVRVDDVIANASVAQIGLEVGVVWVGASCTGVAVGESISRSTVVSLGEGSRHGNHVEFAVGGVTSDIHDVGVGGIGSTNVITTIVSEVQVAADEIKTNGVTNTSGDLNHGGIDCSVVGGSKSVNRSELELSAGGALLEGVVHDGHIGIVGLAVHRPIVGAISKDIAIVAVGADGDEQIATGIKTNVSPSVPSIKGKIIADELNAAIRDLCVVQRKCIDVRDLEETVGIPVAGGKDVEGTPVPSDAVGSAGGGVGEDRSKAGNLEGIVSLAATLEIDEGIDGLGGSALGGDVDDEGAVELGSAGNGEGATLGEVAVFGWQTKGGAGVELLDFELAVGEGEERRVKRNIGAASACVLENRVGGKVSTCVRGDEPWIKTHKKGREWFKAFGA